MQSGIVRLGLAFLLACGAIWQPPVLRAQAPDASAAPAPTSGPEAAEADQQYSLSVEVEVVTVPVTATNSDGEFVTDLDLNEFTIFDNGAPQKIESFELSQEPLSLAILVETSSRIQSLLPEVRSAGILFTQLIVGESGEGAVLTFDRDLKLVQDFTGDADRIETAFRNLQPGGDPVRLSDAIARALFLLQRRPEGRRRVIVVISEARDQGSSNPLGLVLRSAQQLGISVYTVGLSTLRSMMGRPASQGVASPFPAGVAARPTPANQPPTPDAQTNWGAANMNVLALIAELVSTAQNLVAGNPLAVTATATGGQDFSSGGKGELEQALGRIGEELRNQYMLTYRPNNLDNPGFHSIRIAVSRPNVQVRTRPGYMFAPPLRKSPATAKPPTLQRPAPASEETSPANPSRDR